MIRCESCGQITEYYGWASYETWLLNEHLIADASISAFWSDQAAYMYADALAAGTDGDAEGVAVAGLAALMRASFVDSVPGLELPAAWEQLVQASLDRISWEQIATAYIVGVEE